MAAPLSLGTWLTAERATAWCRVLAAIELVWAVAKIAGGHGEGGLPQTDFTPFWTAATLAAHDSPAAIYDQMKMAAIEHSLEPIAGNLWAPFMYPPTYLLLLRPLAFLPPVAALICFVLTGLGLYLLCMRRLLGRGYGLATLAFPAVLVTLGTGQNGFFTAACFGGAALLLERRPFLAGLCLGALSCKPQLALLVPVVLLAARRWRALCGAGASALGLAALSYAVFGMAIWRAFLRSVSGSGHVLNAGLTDPTRLQSVFGAGRILHAPAELGWACQAAMSLAALAALIVVARRRPGGQAEIAALVVATLSATPYLMDYDLTALAIPLAWLLVAAQRDCWRPWEKYGALTAYVMPLLTCGIATTFGLPLAPLMLVAFSAVVIVRASMPAYEAAPRRLVTL